MELFERAAGHQQPRHPVEFLREVEVTPAELAEDILA